MRAVSFPRLERSNSISIEEQLEQAYQRGLSEGMKQAFDKGTAYGRDEAKKKHQQEIQQLEQEIAARLNSEYQALFEQFKLALAEQGDNQKKELQQAIVIMVEELAQHVLDSELESSSAHLKRAVETLLPELDALDQLQELHAAEADATFWQQFDLSEFGQLTLHINPELKSGQVHFSGKTQLYELDFRSRLELLLEQMKHNLEYDCDSIPA